MSEHLIAEMQYENILCDVKDCGRAYAYRFNGLNLCMEHLPSRKELEMVLGDKSAPPEAQQGECLTSEEIGRLEELEKAATPGPWKVYPQGKHGHNKIGTKYDHPQLKAPLGVINECIAVDEPHHRLSVSEEDAELIVAMRNSLRKLLAARGEGKPSA